MNDLRAVLEGIVYGEDPKITPGDRLRAAEQLRDLDERAWPTVQQLLDAMSPEEIAAEWDRQCGAQFVADAFDGNSRYPRFSEALTAAVTVKAAALARELADADRIDAEIERRAQERAEELYRTRAFTAVVASDVLAAAPDATSAAEVPEVASDAPAGLSLADMDRPWRRRPGRESPFRP